MRTKGRTITEWWISVATATPPMPYADAFISQIARSTVINIAARGDFGHHPFIISESSNHWLLRQNCCQTPNQVESDG
jgi:hypothetical protein